MIENGAKPQAATVTLPRFDDYLRDPVTVARRLLGQKLVRIIDGVRIAGIIHETEAYLGLDDQAAHTFNGRRTARNESMYLPGGHAYVYFTYGMHWCLNVVCGGKDEGVAVLLRALQPVEGIDEMHARRAAAKRERDLCSGPARLTQALGIDRTLDGVNLRTDERLFIEEARSRALPSSQIVSGPRIGIGYAGEWVEKPLRFAIAGSAWMSMPRM